MMFDTILSTIDRAKKNDKTFDMFFQEYIISTQDMIINAELKRNMSKLLSNDLTKVESAISEIQDSLQLM